MKRERWKHNIKHTIPRCLSYKGSYYKFKCHVLRYISYEVKRVLQKIEQSLLYGSNIISHIKHTPFALEGSELHRMTYAYESQYGT
jgi:hypothetical protein